MRHLTGLLICALALAACNDERHFEKNIDLKQRYWLFGNRPAIEFNVQDTVQKYNLYINLRNESSYPYSNLYFMFLLFDEEGIELERKLASEFLFDKKSGRPLGSSGIGDIYNHRFALLEDYTFPKAGKYTIEFEQFMRTDTLRGILTVGLRIDKSTR